MLKLGCQWDVVYSGVKLLLGLGPRDVTDGLEDASVVEPVDPFEGGVFHGIKRAPWTTPVDHLGLEQPIDRLGQGIVVTISDAAYRGGLDPGFGQALG